jgi:hypothetical protein
MDALRKVEGMPSLSVPIGKGLLIPRPIGNGLFKRHMQ